MSGNFTDWQVNTWLTSLVNAGVWIGLHTDHPEQAGAYFSELAGGGYGREKPNWSAPSNRTTWNTSTVTYDGLLATTIAYLGFWNAEVTGDLVGWAQLPVPKPILDGQGFVVAANDGVLSIG